MTDKQCYRCEKRFPLSAFHVVSAKSGEFKYVANLCIDCRQNEAKVRSQKQRQELKNVKFTLDFQMEKEVYFDKQKCFHCGSVNVEEKAFYNLSSLKTILLEKKPWRDNANVLLHKDCAKKIRFSRQIAFSKALEKLSTNEQVVLPSNYDEL